MTSKKLQTLQTEKSKLKENIDKQFRTVNKTPYYLHAIVIHDGVADSGHYYVYIYDRKTMLWHKFNDFYSTIVAEEDVLSEAFGG